MKKWKKLASAAMAAMMCAALLTGCGGEKKQADTGDTIKVGAAFELTGNVANYGKSINEGFKLAVVAEAFAGLGDYHEQHGCRVCLDARAETGFGLALQ